MKKVLFFLAAAAALVACTPKQNAKVEKIICPHSGMLKGVVVKYDAQIDEASVNEDTYVVDGPEIGRVIVDSSHVIIAFKGPGKPHHECGGPEGKGPKEGCDKPEGCDKAPKDCCDKPEGKGPKEGCDKPEGCEEAPKDCCDKPEGKGPKEGCDKPEGCDKAPKDCCDKPEGKGPKPGMDKPEGKGPKPEECEGPEINVKQAKDIKTVDGKVVKAWKKAVKAL